MIANFFHCDQRTIYGKNLNKIAELCECPVESLTAVGVKQEMKYFKPPENEAWKCQVVKELLEVKEKTMTVEGFEDDEIEEIINFLCIS